MVEHAAAKVVGDEEKGWVFGLEKKGERIEIVQRSLVANDAEDRHLFGKAGDGRYVPVNAGEPPVAEETLALFGEKEMISVADGHPIAHKDAKMGREKFADGAHGVRFGERSTFFEEGLLVLPGS